MRGRALLYAYCDRHRCSTSALRQTDRRDGSVAAAASGGRFSDARAEWRRRPASCSRETRLLALEPALELCAGAAVRPPRASSIRTASCCRCWRMRSSSERPALCSAAITNPGSFAAVSSSDVEAGQADAEVRARWLINCRGPRSHRTRRAASTGFPRHHIPAGVPGEGQLFLAGRTRAVHSPRLSSAGAGGSGRAPDTRSWRTRRDSVPMSQWVDAIDYDVDAGRSAGFYAAIRKYWPGLPDGALQPAYAGIRPKISGPGEPPADFRIDGPSSHGVAGIINLFGIESPGLTASPGHRGTGRRHRWWRVTAGELNRSWTWRDLRLSFRNRRIRTHRTRSSCSGHWPCFG